MRDIFEQITSEQIKIHGHINGISRTQHIHQQPTPFGSFTKIQLTLTNTTQQNLQINYCFPNLALPSHSSIQYIIPTSPLIYNTQNAKYAFNYGSILQYAFISMKYPNQTDTLMVFLSDKQGKFKQIRFQKSNESIKIAAIYYNILIKSQQSHILPEIYLILHQTNTHFLQQTSYVYQQVSTQFLNIQKPLPSKNHFNESFVMRVLQIFQIQWHQSHRRVTHFADTNLVQMLKQDQQKIGPIKFVHLRDWSSQNRQLTKKFGNYLKKQIVGPTITLKWLRQQIRQLQMLHNVGVGLYVEGYLVSKALFQNNPQWLSKLQSFEMKDEKGCPYSIWGSSNFVLCHQYKELRQVFISSLKEVVNFLQPEGIYIDEFGFGSRTSPYKICTNKLHAHESFDFQVGQLTFLEQLQFTLANKEVNIYIEQTPLDATLTHIQGSLSSAAKQAATRQDRIPLSICRFISPQLKFYELITEYTMAENDLNSKGSIKNQNVKDIKLGIIIAFWNGNGIYVPKNLQFYDKSVLQLIKNCNFYYTMYSDYFRGIAALPLIDFKVDRQRDQVLVNQFTNRHGKSIYTLLNCSRESHICEQYQITLPAETLGIMVQRQYTQISCLQI